ETGEFPVNNLQVGSGASSRDDTVVPFDVVVNQRIHAPDLSQPIQKAGEAGGVLNDSDELKVGAAGIAKDAETGAVDVEHAGAVARESHFPHGIEGCAGSAVQRT